jgi:hypothetical protein
MSRRFSRVRLGTAVVAVTLALLGGACTAGVDDGASAPPSATSTAAGPATSEPAASPGVPAGGTFGSDCPNFPESGEGSLQDLSRRDWLLALAATPALSQWSVMTTVAGLQADFARLEEVTVFAPVDGAFQTLGVDRIRQLLQNPPEAGDLLRYHVVTRRLGTPELAGTHPTLLAGQQIEVTGSGQDFIVNGEAKVVCGNVQAANATIYLIDRVLVP